MFYVIVMMFTKENKRKEGGKGCRSAVKIAVRLFSVGSLLLSQLPDGKHGAESVEEYRQGLGGRCPQGPESFAS